MYKINKRKPSAGMSFSIMALCLGAALLLVVIIQAGCQTVRTDQIVPQEIKIRESHSEKLFARVNLPAKDQGNTENIPTAIVISPEYVKSFNDALQQSLMKSKLFAVVESENTADFTLDVTIMRLDGTPVDASSVTYMVTKWTFRNRETGVVVYEKDITTANTAEAHPFLSNPFNKTQRSLEGSAVANIKQGIEWLSRKTSTRKQ
jgi:hypothetical protein